jgi:hypothetical protein
MINRWSNNAFLCRVGLPGMERGPRKNRAELFTVAQSTAQDRLLVAAAWRLSLVSWAGGAWPLVAVE